MRRLAVPQGLAVQSATTTAVGPYSSGEEALSRAYHAQDADQLGVLCRQARWMAVSLELFLVGLVFQEQPDNFDFVPLMSSIQGGLSTVIGSVGSPLDARCRSRWRAAATRPYPCCRFVPPKWTRLTDRSFPQFPDIAPPRSSPYIGATSRESQHAHSPLSIHSLSASMPIS